MPRPTQRQALIKAARQEGTFSRVEIPRVTCDRCGQDGIYALPDGSPRPHLRATRPGDDGYSAEFPTMTECD